MVIFLVLCLLALWLIIKARNDGKVKDKAKRGECFNLNVLGRDDVVEFFSTSLVYLDMEDKTNLELFNEYKEYVDYLLRITKGIGSIYNRFRAVEKELEKRLEEADCGFQRKEQK